MYAIAIVTEAGEIEELERRPNRLGLMARAKELSRERRGPVVIIRGAELESTVWAPGLKREPRRLTREERENGRRAA